MKLSKSVLAVPALLLCAATVQAEVSSNVAMSTDYIWRGVTQTDSDPAISGGFDYGHESGAYVGTWASNVVGGSEFDLYGGYATEISGVSIDVGAIRYLYPSQGANNFSEGYVALGFMGFSAAANIAITDDFGDYYSLGYEAELPMQTALSVSIGLYNEFQTNVDNTDWKVAVSKEVEGFGLELAYFDVDSDDNSLDDDGLVFTLSKSM